MFFLAVYIMWIWYNINTQKTFKITIIFIMHKKMQAEHSTVAVLINQDIIVFDLLHIILDCVLLQDNL